MKRVVNGKIYDTDTATEIHSWENIYDQTDFHHYEETLYRTKKGNHFVAGVGGPLSPYSQSLGGGSSSGGSGLRPLTLQEAATWLEEHEGHDILTTDEAFADLVEEA